MNDSKIEIAFRLKNEFGERYEAESEFTVFDEIGYSELEEIGMKFNAFLRQVGYVRRNDFIFMEDITEDECDALQNFLDEYRRSSKQQIEREDT